MARLAAAGAGPRARIPAAARASRECGHARCTRAEPQPCHMGRSAGAGRARRPGRRASGRRARCLRRERRRASPGRGASLLPGRAAGAGAARRGFRRRGNGGAPRPKSLASGGGLSRVRGIAAPRRPRGGTGAARPGPAKAGTRGRGARGLRRVGGTGQRIRGRGTGGAGGTARKERPPEGRRPRRRSGGRSRAPCCKR